MQNTENKFNHNGLWYIAVEQDGCRNCEFDTGKNSHVCKLDLIPNLCPGCSKCDRQDNRSVIFVESDVDNLGDEE